ncbi:hypothetical protein A3I58_04115 [Candidatus Peregrinibacteria bacterium RIFCSPLOWO2_02_FULL_39_10]|nr:MAG: hypothetical protein A3I58_04115 [Candidatus Peregrinibacteria bacterium RIFCSPLOWO2_02_FULL_39_10]
MSHKKYMAIIGGAGLLAWLGFFLVISKLSPYENMGLSLGLFFITLFIALSSTFAAFGFYFRVWLFKNEIFYKHINVALRQGIFLSLIAILCLVFQMMRVLTWWSGALLVSVSVLLEAYFSAKDSEVY